MGIRKWFYYMENGIWCVGNLVKTDDPTFLHRVLLHLNPNGPVYILISFRAFFSSIALEAQRILTGRSFRHASVEGGMKPQKGISLDNPSFADQYLELQALLINNEIKRLRQVTDPRIIIKLVLDHHDDRHRLKWIVCLERMERATKPKSVFDLDLWITAEQLEPVPGVDYITSTDEADRELKRQCSLLRAAGVPASAIATKGTDADEEAFIDEDLCRFFERTVPSDLDHPLHVIDKAAIRKHSCFPFKSAEEVQMAAWAIGTDFTQLRVGDSRYDGMHGVGFATLVKGGYQWWLESGLEGVKERFEKSEVATNLEKKGQEAYNDFSKNLEALTETCISARDYWNPPDPPSAGLFKKSDLKKEVLKQQREAAPEVKMDDQGLKVLRKRGRRTAPSKLLSKEDQEA